MAIRVNSVSTHDIAVKVSKLASTWVHRDVPENERAEQRLLLIHLMVAALWCLTALPLVLIAYFGPLQMLPIIMVAVSIPLLLMSFQALTGSRRATAALALVCGAGGVMILATLTGGLSSPFLAWSIVLPLEAAILGRTRRAVASGLIALLCTIAGVVALSALLTQSEVPGLAVVGSFTSLAGLAFYGLFAIGFANRKTTNDGANAEPPTDTTGLYDRLSGLITFHNERGEVRSVHGSGAHDLLANVGELAGNGFVEQIHVSDRLQFLQAVDGLRAGEDARTVAVRMRCDDGVGEQEQFRHWSIQLAALRNRKGQFVGFLAQSQDITSEAVLQLSYARKVGEAEAANQAKTRFLAAVSHELRTPLNAILGFSDILTSAYCSQPLDESQAEYVGLIRQSGQHLLEVINSMLDLSKIEAGRYELNLEAFDVREAISDCEAMLGQQARDKNIVLNTRVAKGHKQLVACRRAVQQILINLIANAIKFTEDGGIVTVDGSDQDGFTRIAVSDTGIGMSQEDLQKVGSPFVQVQTHNAREYEGTGLGLSLVKGLVELHDGRFSIESTLGVGTTVTIDLPLVGPRGGTLAAETGPVPEPEFPPRLSAHSANGREGGHAQAKSA